MVSYLQMLRDARTRDDLARLLGYSPKGLAFVLYKIPEEKKYVSFDIPKRSGGVRTINAPTAELKLLQSRLTRLLYQCREETRKAGYRSLAHAFEQGRSIITNAALHRRRRYVLNLDLKDYFPSFNFGRVRGFFIKDKNFALNEHIATVIAQIACHDNELPQGSPCSPIISNLIGHLLDVRLTSLAMKHQCTYSRYADDITFSTNQKNFPQDLAFAAKGEPSQWKLGAALLDKIERAGFQVNDDKTRMQFRGSRQVTTGLLVNEKVNTLPEYYRTARAMCQTLFSTGTYYRVVPATLSGGKRGDEPKKVICKEFAELEGILAHIYRVKRDTDWGKIVGKRKTPYKRTIYARFLFYKFFVAPKSPLIVPEGKTDTIYLRAAIKRLEKYHPKLGGLAGGTFSSNVSFLKCSPTVESVLQLGNGTGGLVRLIENYARTISHFPNAPCAHPIILVIDNDAGATPVFSILKKNGVPSIALGTKDAFYHICENLYLVKTPEIGATSCIEDLFDAELLNTKINGNHFDPNKEHDSDGSYGKHKFAIQVVRPNIRTIDFSKFEMLLDRIVAVLDDYSQRLKVEP